MTIEVDPRPATRETLPAETLRPGPGQPSPFVSLCERCGRIGPFTYDDLARFAREGWPCCCGRQMLCSTPDAPGIKRYGYS